MSNKENRYYSDNDKTFIKSIITTDVKLQKISCEIYGKISLESLLPENSVIINVFGFFNSQDIILNFDNNENHRFRLTPNTPFKKKMCLLCKDITVSTEYKECKQDMNLNNIITFEYFVENDANKMKLIYENMYYQENDMYIYFFKYNHVNTKFNKWKPAKKFIKILNYKKEIDSNVVNLNFYKKKNLYFCNFKIVNNISSKTPYINNNIKPNYISINIDDSDILEYSAEKLENIWFYINECPLKINGKLVMNWNTDIESLTDAKKNNNSFYGKPLFYIEYDVYEKL